VKPAQTELRADLRLWEEACLNALVGLDLRQRDLQQRQEAAVTRSANQLGATLSRQRETV
jgi:hypothetical protein